MDSPARPAAVTGLTGPSGPALVVTPFAAEIRPERTVEPAGEIGAASPAGSAQGSVHLILRNSTLNLIGQGLNAAFNLVVVFLLARGLGQAVLGEFSALTALVIVVQWVLNPGVTTVLTSRIARAPASWEKVAAEAGGLFTIIILASAGALAAMGAGWAWLRQEPSVLLSFAAAGLACAALQVQQFCVGILRAFELFGYETSARVLQGALFAGLVLVAFWQGLGSLPMILALFAASHILAAACLLHNLQRRCGWLGWQLHPTALRSWLAEAVPLGLGDVVRTLTWQLDTILLSLLQPAAVVGIYSVAYRPLGPLNWLPRAVLQALFPAFARMAADDRTSLDRAFAHSIRLLWIISLPLAVAICFCAEPLITLLAGREYQAAVVPMRLLIWITSLSFLSAQFRFLFAAVGKQRLFAWLVILVFTVEAAVELLLIPHWGYFGACAGSVSGELLFTAVGLFICRRLGIGRIEWGALLRAAVAAGGMAGMLWFARGLSLPWLLAATAGATGTYFALCIWLGALQGDELRRFGEALTGLLRPAAGRRRPAERAAGLGEDHFG